MNRLFLLALISIAAFTHKANSQNYKFQGTVIDSNSQQTIEGVAIQVMSADEVGKTYSAITNTNGKFALMLPANSYQLNLSIIGYSQAQLVLTISTETEKTFELSPLPFSLGEVVVSSFRVNRSVKELPTPLAVIGKYDYQRHSGITLSNVLANEPGIAVGGDGV